MAGAEFIIVHAGLQLICWLFLLPLSLYVVRSKLSKDWTLHHRNLNLTIILGVLGAVLAMVIAHASESGESSHGHGRRLGGGHGGKSDKISLPHKETGWTLVALIGCQFFLLGLLRPGESSAYKPSWRILHRGIGYVISLLSIYQIVSGFLYESVNAETRILIVSIFLPIIATLWALAYYFYLRKLPSDRRASKADAIEDGTAQEFVVIAADEQSEEQLQSTIDDNQYS